MIVLCCAPKAMLWTCQNCSKLRQDMGGFERGAWHMLKSWTGDTTTGATTTTHTHIGLPDQALCNCCSLRLPGAGL